MLGTTPIFVGIIATLVGLERLGSGVLARRRGLLRGVGLIAAGASGGLSGSLLGDVLAVATAATWAAYSVAVAPLMKTLLAVPDQLARARDRLGPARLREHPADRLAEHRRVRLDDGRSPSPSRSWGRSS